MKSVNDVLNPLRRQNTVEIGIQCGSSVNWHFGALVVFPQIQIKLQDGENGKVRIEQYLSRCLQHLKHIIDITLTDTNL